VKENQDMKIFGGSDFSRKYQLSTFYAASPNHNQTILQRNQLFLDGKSHLRFQKLSCCKRSAWTVSQKNALVQLNELRPGLRYEIVSKTGPLHAPVFSVGVEVNGFHFEGRGPTKKQAKMRAAELALQSFIQFPNTSQAHIMMENLDFTADAFLTEFEPSLLKNCDFLECNTAKTEVFSNICKNRKSRPFTLDLISSTNSKRQFVLLKHLNPVALLNQLRPGLRYMCQVEKVRGTPVKNFIMVVRLEGKVFEGCSHTKRQAKAQAATEALQSLYNINLGPERKLITFQGSRTKCQLPQDLTSDQPRLCLWPQGQSVWTLTQRMKTAVLSETATLKFSADGRWMKVNGGGGTLPVTSRRTNQNWASVSPGPPVCMTSMSCTDKIAKKEEGVRDPIANLQELPVQLLAEVGEQDA
ncbi:hypothetical protein GOODEAATRI_008612, partial [Goodea atripinnis]